MKTMLQTLNFIRQSGNADYQARIPQATRDNIAAVGNAIMTYPTHANEFISDLVNKIALTEVLTSRPDSVFGEFVGQDLLYGDTIESIYVKIAKGETFAGDNLTDGDSLDPFKVKKPAVEVAYHRVDRKMVYTVTVQEANMKNAFLNPGAFKDFVNGIINSLRDGAERDLYMDGLSLLDADIYGKTVALGSLADAEELAKGVLAGVRNVSTYMPFTRKEFNKLQVETSTPKAEMVLFLRADVKDIIDLTVLANAYNFEKLTTDITVKLVDEFIDKDQVAAIIDKRHIKINHSVRQTTSQYNALGLYTNYFSHVHRLVSYNPFANAVKITGKVA